MIFSLVDDLSLPVAQALGIEVYSYADALENLKPPQPYGPYVVFRRSA